MPESERVGQTEASESKHPGIISDPCGDTYALGACESDALAEAVANFGEDEVEGIGWVGWMCQVPYPEDFDNREEWEQSPNFTERWYEGCQAPTNDKQRGNAVQAWRVIFR